jgi:SAM-dependent methyltransferase
MTRADRASGEVYHSARLAAGYACARPPVHPRIVGLIARRLGIAADTRRRCALDVGCGAGLSTAPLSSLAESVVGVDPAPAMLAHHQTVAPEARFAVGSAQAQPFPEATFDLVTCAGALNYTDVDRALREIARVLAPSGTLVVYDFSAGRRCRGGIDLDGWFGEFEAQYPFPPGYALEVNALDYQSAGLHLVSWETFEIPLVLALEGYLAYVLSETNVQRALSRGGSEEDIRAWCRGTLEPLFEQAPLAVLFDGYIACIAKSEPFLVTNGGK